MPILRKDTNGERCAKKVSFRITQKEVNLIENAMKKQKLKNQADFYRKSIIEKAKEVLGESSI